MSKNLAGRGEGLNDAIERVKLMATGDPQWDLSENDMKALKLLVAALEAAAPPGTANASFARGFAKALDRVHYHFHDFEKGEDACKPLHVAIKKAEADLAALARPSSVPVGEQKQEEGV